MRKNRAILIFLTILASLNLFCFVPAQANYFYTRVEQSLVADDKLITLSRDSSDRNNFDAFRYYYRVHDPSGIEIYEKSFYADSASLKELDGTFFLQFDRSFGRNPGLRLIRLGGKKLKLKRRFTDPKSRLSSSFDFGKFFTLALNIAPKVQILKRMNKRGQTQRIGTIFADSINNFTDITNTKNGLVLAEHLPSSEFEASVQTNSCSINTDLTNSLHLVEKRSISRELIAPDAIQIPDYIPVDNGVILHRRRCTEGGSADSCQSSLIKIDYKLPYPENYVFIDDLKKPLDACNPKNKIDLFSINDVNYYSEVQETADSFTISIQRLVNNGTEIETQSVFEREFIGVDTAEIKQIERVDRTRFAVLLYDETNYRGNFKPRYTILLIGNNGVAEQIYRSETLAYFIRAENGRLFMTTKNAVLEYSYLRGWFAFTHVEADADHFLGDENMHIEGGRVYYNYCVHNDEVSDLIYETCTEEEKKDVYIKNL